MNSFLISSILFWVVVYILEGLHDVNVIRSSNFEKGEEISLWHFWDSIMFLVIHAWVGIYFYLYTSDLKLSIAQIILSFGIRVSVHESMLNLIIHKDIGYQPTENQNNPFDNWLSKQNSLIVFIYRYGLTIATILIITITQIIK